MMRLSLHCYYRLPFVHFCNLLICQVTKLCMSSNYKCLKMQMEMHKNFNMMFFHHFAGFLAPGSDWIPVWGIGHFRSTLLQVVCLLVRPVYVSLWT